ncbi:hypothetical protein [uncultured Acidaminococcus sp.]|uniref:hypothetical protein n=1 Tax=uncultured Acidaminococcus sp. TaxID=352152 RepID=UPI0025F5F595|nr:hypothetical protein [uncultured Acidaminococcus sp.]
MEKKNVGGRPRGRKKISKIEVVIEPEVKATFMSILNREGKKASIEIGNWIRKYIDEHSKTK